MQTISVRTQIRAPIDAVFTALSDHERFVQQPGTVTRVLRLGDSEPHGLGCVREVRVTPGLRFVEEITAFQRPIMYEYVIRKSTLPLRHQGSRLSLSEQDGVTEVEWTGTAEVPIPIIGGLLMRVLNSQLKQAFAAMLHQARASLEGRK